MSSNMNSTETKQKKRTFDEIKTKFIDNEEKELIIKKLKVSEELVQKFDSIEDSIQLNCNQIIDEFEDKKTIDKQINERIDEQIVPQINDCSKVSSNSSQSSNERSNWSQNSVRVEDIPECVKNYRIVPNIEQNEE